MSSILWRRIQKENFHCIKKLSNFLNLSQEEQAQLWHDPRFILNLPKRLAEKIEKASLQDPVLKQFIPLKKENISLKGFSLDPVGDQNAQVAPKLIHKYEGRVLLLPSSACAMHCRYCFRRHFPYEKQKTALQEELNYISSHTDIHEVILSGGDPLSLSNQELKDIFSHIDRIPHVKNLRFHSRFPIGIPERIDEEFLDLLNSSSKQLVFVLHCNHAQELDEDIFQAMKNIQRLGCPVLCQTVFLKGVNDNKEALKNLFLSLTYHGIIPYYLHLLDKVQGAEHFLQAKEKGLEIMKSLQEELPGYAIPKFVCEIPGEKSKTAVK